MPDDSRRAEWMAGRSRYQQVVALNRKKMLDWLRAHPDSTSDEIYTGTGNGVASVQKFVSAKKVAGAWRYRALTLEEFDDRQSQKRRTYDSASRFGATSIRDH